jgi:hypothetical protein
MLAVAFFMGFVCGEFMVVFDPAVIDDKLVDEYSWCGFGVRSEPSAEDYLDFAKLDLVDGDSARHRINALSNVKRALHLRVEDLCLGFGFGKSALEKNRGFKPLVNYLRDCGVVAPEVLDLINASRNSVEHDFVIPEKMDVRVFHGVVELFLEATNRWVQRQPCDVKFLRGGFDSSGEYELISAEFVWHRGEVVLNYSRAGESGRNCKDRGQLVVSGEDFRRWSKLLLRNNY